MSSRILVKTNGSGNRTVNSRLDRSGIICFTVALCTKVFHVAVDGIRGIVQEWRDARMFDSFQPKVLVASDRMALAESEASIQRQREIAINKSGNFVSIN